MIDSVERRALVKYCQNSSVTLVDSDKNVVYDFQESRFGRMIRSVGRLNRYIQAALN